MSAPLPDEQVAKLARGLFYYWSLLHNNNMATNIQMFAFEDSLQVTGVGVLPHVAVKRIHLGR